MSDILTVIEWTTIPDAAFRERDRAPLYVNRENWGRYPGDDWSAALAARYDDFPEVAVELSVGRVEEGGQVGYVAGVNGPGSERFRKLCLTLHGAMAAAEEHAAEVCSRIPEPAAAPAP
jgi:hypothetical protein